MIILMLNKDYVRSMTTTGSFYLIVCTCVLNAHVSWDVWKGPKHVGGKEVRGIP